MWGCFTEQVQSGHDAAFQVGDRFGGWLRNLGWPPAAAETLVSAVSAALDNACVHAYPAGAPGPVVLRTHPLGGLNGLYRMVVTVADRGRWRDPGPHALPGGRQHGLGLIRARTDHLQLTGTAAGTRLTMISPPERLRLPAHPLVVRTAAHGSPALAGDRSGAGR